jgi:pimeloyl-ACP methyl ester carboxylesterase
VLFEAPIANTGHLAGLIWGAWIAFVVASRHRRPPVRNAILAATMLLLIPSVQSATHPVWLAEYQVYTADLPGQNPEIRRLALRRAVQANSQFELAWEQLLDLETERGDWPGAWRLAVRALAANPQSKAIRQRARPIWRRMQIDGDAAATQTAMREAFGDRAASVEAELRRGLSGVTWPNLSNADHNRIDTPLNAPWTDGREPSPLRPFDPDDELSAAAGTLL